MSCVTGTCTPLYGGTALLPNSIATPSGIGSENATVATTNAAKRYAVIAGHPSAITFASQMTKTEQLRNQSDFGDLVRGLQVFGHKVVKPEALSLLVCS